MAFLRKAGSILRQTAGRQINSEICGASPSVFQIIRCMSSAKVFIGGLSYSTDEQSLGEACSKYGEVVEARIIMDRETARSRGFGFVTFASPEAASAAIQALDQQELHGRRVRVNYATEKPRGGGFGYGGGYGGGDGGYGGSGGGYGGGGGGYGGGGGNYGGGGGNYGGGGGNYGGGGGSYGGGGGGYGGGNYNQGGESVGNFGDSQGSNLDGGDFGTVNQGFGLSGGGGGTDSFASGDAGANTSLGNSSGFDGENSAGALSQDDSIKENLRDDNDEPSDYAKRA